MGVHDDRNLPHAVVLILGGAALTVGGGNHITHEVVGIPLRGAVRLSHAGDAAPLIQQVRGLAAVAVQPLDQPAAPS